MNFSKKFEKNSIFLQKLPIFRRFTFNFGICWGGCRQLEVFWKRYHHNNRNSLPQWTGSLFKRLALAGEQGTPSWRFRNLKFMLCDKLSWAIMACRFLEKSPRVHGMMIVIAARYVLGREHDYSQSCCNRYVSSPPALPTVCLNWTSKWISEDLCEYVIVFSHPLIYTRCV